MLDFETKNGSAATSPDDQQTKGLYPVFEFGHPDDYKLPKTERLPLADQAVVNITLAGELAGTTPEVAPPHQQTKRERVGAIIGPIFKQLAYAPLAVFGPVASSGYLPRTRRQP